MVVEYGGMARGRVVWCGGVGPRYPGQRDPPRDGVTAVCGSVALSCARGKR